MSTPNDRQAVRAWEEPVVIPTYPAMPPDPNPMFLEKRVYQGSSGKVYPNPFTDRVSDEKEDKSYRGVFLENEYVRLMILPEIGGRIHVGTDKTTGYDFFYRQHVIKPALVGLLGPWISGGVEFNWPQHHRPSTFMPVEQSIEEHPDGSRTVWLSEHEPMNRMKGMVGICLRPGSSVIEAKARLYNRTPFVQTFLWWANVGVRVHDRYQSFFPPDVEHVADHARRAMSSFPVAKNLYYGVDYTKGVDLTWYKNIPVPTSYMVLHSDYDFFGGYDHSRRAGLVHVADRHIAPGKKQWTWGNAEFGYAWDRELTDEDGPYIELMAGLFTDNQPDFSFLHPYETRTFSQYWYPIQEIGPAQNANRRMAINLAVEERRVKVGVCASERFPGARVLLTAGEDLVCERRADIEPGRPLVFDRELARECRPSAVVLRVLSADGAEVIRYRPVERKNGPAPEPATEPPPPEEVATCEELYLTGLHLHQYRHATRDPEAYWDEALRRDPDDVRCNNAMGSAHLRSGRFADSEAHFRRAIARLTRRNANPYDGEPYYNLGLALRFQDRLDEAYDAFYKSAWNYAWQAASHYQLATIASARGDWALALEHLDRSLAANPSNLKARRLKSALLERSGRVEESAELARESSAIDAFSGRPPADAQTCLDFAFDCAEAGLWKEARRLLRGHLSSGASHPMVYYTLAWIECELGDDAAAASAYDLAAKAPSDYCFPSRLEEMIVLQAAIAARPEDARAPYYLGNLLYDKRRREEAIGQWERAASLDPGFSIPWRNLGIAYFNVRKDGARAQACYRSAFAANPRDARVLYELDQLEKRLGSAPKERLARLEQRRDLVAKRDDLTVELITLYNQTGAPGKALEILSTRRFHPWEGGEGLVSTQWVTAHMLLGRQLLDSRCPEQALAHFEAAGIYPPNLGEGKHLLTAENHLDYFAGVALRQLGREREAHDAWARAVRDPGVSPLGYYRALALAALGRPAEGSAALSELREAGRRQLDADVKIDYFATSLPNFLLFEADLEKNNRIEGLFLIGLAELGLQHFDRAADALQEVLALDVNHIGAQQELAALERMQVSK